MNAVAVTVDDITPAWLSEALGQPVDAVAAERIGTGQIGATHRLSIGYADGAAGPDRLVAKLAAEDPSARALVAEGYRKEVAFYAHLLSSLAVRTPRCWYSAISDDATTFTLLLDDLAPAQAGVQANGCTVAEAIAAVRNVTGLHAPRWNDRSLAEYDFLSFADETAAAFVGDMHVDATERFVARYADALDSEDVATMKGAAAATASWLTARPEPFSLIHGDYRLDNLMFDPDRGTVSVVDWQTLNLGPPARDVAYLLGTSLDVPERRTHEVEIVRVYFDELVARGVDDYDADQCFDDYRLGQLHAPLITVFGCEYATAARTAQADAMFLAMARRSCAAIRDLHVLDRF
jgi:Phosphotransferase enzyme family